MEIIIIIILILLNGIFSMAEMSLISSKKYKLESEKLKGNVNAKTAIELSENPNKFLSTVQIGITLIGILLGIYSGDKLTINLAENVAKIDFLTPYASTIASSLIVIIITFFSIVFGELLPKRLGLKFPESIALIFAKPMFLLSKIASPFVWLLTVTNEIVLKLLGINTNDNEIVTEEEIKSIIREGSEGGVIEEKEHDIMKNAFELSDRKVNSLATHKSEIVALDSKMSFAEVKEIIKQKRFSVYPIVEDNNLDNIIGIVKLKDLFFAEDENFSLTNYINKAVFVSENSFIYPLLESFQNNKAHMAICIDEYGTTKGIVTLNDIMDDLVGDIPDGNDDVDEQEIIKRDDNSWLIDGQCSLHDFKKHFKVNIDDEIENNYVTVSGLFFNKSENIPHIGDKIEIGNYLLEIIDKDGNRIDKILAFRKKNKD